jgi:hypothetical protein
MLAQFLQELNGFTFVINLADPHELCQGVGGNPGLMPQVVRSGTQA